MDDLDNMLRSAAEDLRTETAGLTPPEFTPGSSRTGPFLAGAAAAVLIIVGVFGVRVLLDGQPTTQGIDAVDTNTTVSPASTSTVPPDQTPAPDLPLPAPADFDLSDAIQHADSVQLTNAEQPPVGGAGSDGTPWSEPDFGTAIQRITDVQIGGAITPAFSSSQTINPSGSLIVLYEQGVGHRAYDANTFASLGPIDIDSDDVYNFSWHPTDESLLYFPNRGDGASNSLIELNVRTRVRRVAATFDQCIEIGQGFGFGSTANGTSFMGLLCEQANGDHWMSYNLVTGDTVIAAEVDTTSTAPWSASVDGSLYAAFTNTAIRVLGADLSPTAQDPIIAAADSVAVTVGGPNANPVAVVSLSNDSISNGVAIGFDLITGERFSLLDDTNGFGVVSGAEMASTLSAGAVVVTTGTPNDGIGDPFDGEILLIRIGESPVVYRLGRHRLSQDLGFGSEWGTGSFLALDPLGRYVLFSSDFGGGTAINTFAISLD